MLNRVRQVFLLAAISLLLSSCASVSIEKGYVFNEEDATESLMPKPLNCDRYGHYISTDKLDGADEPAYYALYQEDKNLRAYISLVPASGRDHVMVGPGVVVPLPIIPNPYALGNQAAYNAKPHKSLQTFRIAVYPYPHTKGYTFTPGDMQIQVGDKWLSPTNITHYFTHNSRLDKVDRPDTTEVLDDHSTEYHMYLVDFVINSEDYVEPVQAVKVSGFELSGEQLAAKEYPVNYAEIDRFDWWTWWTCF